MEAREEQLAASQHELGDARDRVRELEHAMTRKESLVAEMSEGLRRAEDEASSEAEMLASHVEESQVRLIFVIFCGSNHVLFSYRLALAHLGLPDVLPRRVSSASNR